ncbi:sideroflexin-4 isoform X4 [Phycodurus eques]|uniref:sideroflexin-4 isoform X4 n=1 Tax=Phycodurus eques TaxID=693459 RepID=UPI002ACDA5EE|nr:sideroflexin-4 isoform X4 [Phycodurus eques]
MDANLLYWKSHGESVFSRLKVWVNLLDPSFLLTSNKYKKPALNLEVKKKSRKRMNMHGTSPFRPSILILVLCFHWFSALQGQTASLKQLLLIAGTVSYATCAGALPQIIVNRLGTRSLLIQNFFRFIVPVPLSAALAFSNVFTVRGEECETGIQVFDSNGNTVGISKAAAEKAVMETALSRAVLFGTTGAVPSLLVSVLKRTRLFQKNSLLIPPIRHISVAFVLGLMIPLSFSLFSQMGTIRKENVEEELQAKMAEGQLFYHRGL